MPKLLAEEKFLDLSDYGRKPASYLAEKIKLTATTPIHITILFGIVGLAAIYTIIIEMYFLSALFLVLKSILDAMDGELARIKDTPSYAGRYLDSIFDSLLNFGFLVAIGFVTQSPTYLILIAFVCLQLQGTLYNYYYVILRHRSSGGDTTSQIFEMKTPKAFPIERQITVNVLFKLYMALYFLFDKSIYLLDNGAYKMKTFPNWFMTMVSAYGLGFQLLIMAIMLSIGLVQFIIPFFIFYCLLIPVFISIRRLVLN